MDSHVPVPVQTGQSMIPATADAEDPEITPAPGPGKKKRQRQARKQKPTKPLKLPQPKPSTKPKKTPLLEEISDALVDHLGSAAKRGGPNLDNEVPASNTSVVDHLSSNMTTNLIIAPSGANSMCSSSRTLTGKEITPAASLDDSNANKLIAPTPTPALSNPPHPSKESLRSIPITGQKCGVFSLDDLSEVSAIHRLIDKYGKVAHMGILDRSYRFFVNKTRTAALSFKVQSGVAVVGGDPLCEVKMIPELLEEFSTYRRKQPWSIAFMGMSESFARNFAQPRGWTTIRFGTERVLNPLTNEVLLEGDGGRKRIVGKNRQLLDPKRGGVTLGVDMPARHGANDQLQSDLVGIYDNWRAERNKSTGLQAFITVYDPFAIPDLMTFVYCRDTDGKINGFAALRRLGNGGYHIDPCIASPGPLKGISDLLIIVAMSLLHHLRVPYLGFGFEPSRALSPKDITGMPGPIATLTRELYGHTFQHLPLGGKKAYHDKFHPDAAQDSGSYLVFPRSMPSLRHIVSVLHMANISMRKLLMADLRAWRAKYKTRCSRDSATATATAPAEDGDDME